MAARATLDSSLIQRDAYTVAYRKSRKGPSTFDFSMLLDSVKDSGEDARHALRPQFKPKSNKLPEREELTVRRMEIPHAKRYSPRTAITRCASVVIYSNEGTLLQHLIKAPATSTVGPGSDPVSRGNRQNAYITRCKKIQSIQKRRDFYHSVTRVETKALINKPGTSTFDLAQRCRTASADFRRRYPQLDRAVNTTVAERSSVSDQDEDYMHINPTQLLEAK